MKTVITFTTILLASMGTLIAQPKNPNHFMMSPFYFLDGTFMLTYERLFQTGSLRITPSVTLQNLSNHKLIEGHDQREGWSLDAGYKFFLTSRPYKVNFYMGPYGLFRSLSSYYQTHDYENGTYRDNTDTYHIVSFGIDGGIKCIFGRFVMDVSLGGGVRYPYLNGAPFKGSASNVFDVQYKGIVPRGNFSLGVAF